MPCFSIILRGSKLAGEQTLNIRRPLKCKYIKLLHCHTNISSNLFQDTLDDTGLITIQNNSRERLLFIKFDFVNVEQYDNFEDGHSYISLGATSDNSTDKLVVRDLYKVLVNKPTTELIGDISVRLYYMTGDCKIRPLEASDVATTITPTINDLSFLNLIVEYEEVD